MASKSIMSTVVTLTKTAPPMSLIVLGQEGDPVPFPVELPGNFLTDMTVSLMLYQYVIHYPLLVSNKRFYGAM